MFKRIISAVILFLTLYSAAEGGKSHLMRFADVSKDDVVFTYENDLWIVPITGGEARRITRSEGTEIYAKFSPDGSMLAFTANYDGGSDVYVMKKESGTPVRLTFHPAADLVLDWFPDGKHILFRSTREYPTRAQMLYKISIEGGVPEKLPIDRAGLASLSPDGKSIVYNRGSREFRNWKRHKGGTAQDLWMGSLKSFDYQKITEFEGTDNFPMWAKERSIYFTSDRKDGTMNLFRRNLDDAAITQLTFYKNYDVKYPSFGHGKIVYQCAESLFLYDIESEKASPLEVTVLTDRAAVRSEYINAANFVGGFGLSPKGERAILDIRGDIINFPVEDGVVYNLTRSSGIREKNPAFASDGEKVVYLSDRTGEEELYIANCDGGDVKQLTQNGKGFREKPIWSPDGNFILFHDKFMRLNLASTETGKITIIDQGDYDDGWYNWGIQGYAFSPDSKWVAYSKLEQSLNQSIFLYSIAGNEIFRVTGDMTQDWSPSFSKDGKYLFFLSNRDFKPIMGFVDQNHIFVNMARPYILILEDNEPSPFSPNNISDKNEKQKEKDNLINVKIRTDDFERRIVGAPVSPGNLFRLEAVDGGFLFLEKEEHEFLKYQFVSDATTASNHDLYRFDIKRGKADLLMLGISQYHLSNDAKKMIYKSGSTYGVVAVGKAKRGDGRINLSEVNIKIDKQSEFMQIFNEAWRVQRDWFYDKNMHGLNWDKAGEKYRRFVPFCGTRTDLNYLIGEMIAELNIGHTYINGGDYARPESVPTGYLGAEFALVDGYTQVKRILPSENWNSRATSPFYQPGCPIKIGSFILAIDNEDIKKGDNIFRYLQHKRGKVIELTYNDKPSLEGAKKYLVKTLGSERTLRYREWVNRNFAYVDKATGGKVGYIHLPGMMENGLVEFAKAFYPQHYKDGLIIDVRYNGGGFTSKQIIDRLERKINTMTQPREGKANPTPERTFRGHLVLIINKDTGSDGEIFSEAWKIRKFGPIIGHRTWGGAVGIEPHQPLVDGAVTTPPQFGPYDLTGKWSIEGRGVEPDIEVINLPRDVLNGKDAQLEKAIESVLQMIREKPVNIPDTPQYPDKSKESLR